MEKSNLNEELEQEIRKRVEKIENPAYDPGPSINKIDIFAMVVISAICIAGLIWGYM